MFLGAVEAALVKAAKENMSLEDDAMDMVGGHGGVHAMGGMGMGMGVPMGMHMSQQQQQMRRPTNFRRSKDLG